MIRECPTSSAGPPRADHRASSLLSRQSVHVDRRSDWDDRPFRTLGGRRLNNSMRSSGIEDLKSVLRRSAVLIVAVVVIGVGGMNVIRQGHDPSYNASRVSC
jgi:hypothetical protein